jgi:hypothetical protein
MSAVVLLIGMTAAGIVAYVFFGTGGSARGELLGSSVSPDGRWEA